MVVTASVCRRAVVGTVSSKSDLDGFQWAVATVADEFAGVVSYEVAARVVMEEWGRFRRTRRKWTPNEVADAASERLQRTLEVRRRSLSSRAN